MDFLPIIEPNEEARLEGDMSYDEAWKYLADRIGRLDPGASVESRRQKFREVAKLVLSQVRTGYWSKYTLDQLDLLPTLDAILQTDKAALTIQGTDGDEVTIGDRVIKATKEALGTAVAKEMRMLEEGGMHPDGATEVVRQRIEATTFGPSRGQWEPERPTAQDYQAEDSGYDDQVDEVVSTVTSGERLIETGFDPYGESDGSTIIDFSGAPAPLLTRQQFQEAMARFPDQALEIAVSQEGAFREQQSYRQQAREAGATQQQLNDELGFLRNNPVNVQYGGRGVDQGGFTGPQDKGMSLNQILSMPTNMTRTQVVRMTERLEAAGYFEGSGRPGIPGDASDRNFQEAWKKLVNSSIANGKPMLELLNEQEEAKKDAERALNRLKVSLTDGARIRINADTLARSMIGRKLSPEEQESMIEYVHNLQREQAQAEADLEVSDEDGELEELDWSARMEEEIRRRNEGEAGAKDIANTYDDFTGLLAGPGPGVGRST